jgi:dynactin complex subunit
LKELLNCFYKDELINENIKMYIDLVSKENMVSEIMNIKKDDEIDDKIYTF